GNSALVMTPMLRASLAGARVFGARGEFIGTVLGVSDDGALRVATKLSGTLELVNAVARIDNDRVWLRTSEQALAPYLDDDFTRLRLE
ncbi:hypothetical protein, partial [Stappia sp.]|uniref:hypothetical protein n=1 Tax=Stappia sp. TaxID=1870903 RepID=UPI003A9A3004